MNKYLVFLEQRDGIVKKASIDAWNRVQELARLQPYAVVSGIIAGMADIRQLDGLITGDGVIFLAKNESLNRYNQEYYTRLVSDIFQHEACDALYFADTAMTRDLAPRLSVRLQASLLAGIPVVDGEAAGSCRRPVYSGSLLATFVPRRENRIYILSSRITARPASSDGHIDFMDLAQQWLTAGDMFPVVRRLVMQKGSPDVAEADIIIAGGRGMGSAEGFVLLEQLASLLGGAVGSSRTVVDEGWRPHAEQVGQTGKTVTSSLYVACGISGAIQHLAGIGSAGIIVAINSDPHAPIFDVADYGIVGDVHVVLPKLFDSLKEFLKKK